MQGINITKFVIVWRLLLTNRSSIYETKEDNLETIKKIIQAAQELDKMIVATGDVHHLTKQDKIYREVYISAPMVGGGVHPLVNCKNLPSFHFRSTEEMLKDFEFLGEEFAHEIVITNTNKIANMVEQYNLFPKELFAPQDDFLADRGVPSISQATIDMTYRKAKDLYGEELPQYIKDRLDKKEHGKREFPPAWKALEYMSFGTIIKLYDSIKNPHLRCDISKVYGMSSPSQFSNYINTVRKLRNYCAHGKVLFDLNLNEAIGNGPLGNLGNRKVMLSGMYMVFKYFLNKISTNRVKEMQADLLRAFDRIPYQIVKTIIFNNSGFTIEEI